MCAPVFGRRLTAALLAAPVRAPIGNTYRSRAEQQRLYDGWKARKPGFNPANPPGKGEHDVVDADGNPAARAADLRRGAGLDWLHDNATRFGLTFPYDHEPWHVESDGRPHPIDDEELDMTKDELRAVVRAEVNAAVALVLRGDKTHPDHLKQLRADVKALSAKVDKLQG
jgi:hypothetical protein